MVGKNHQTFTHGSVDYIISDTATNRIHSPLFVLITDLSALVWGFCLSHKAESPLTNAPDPRTPIHYTLSWILIVSVEIYLLLLMGGMYTIEQKFLVFYSEASAFGLLAQDIPRVKRKVLALQS